MKQPQGPVFKFNTLDSSTLPSISACDYLVTNLMGFSW